jgi:hypothetical protein
LIQHQGLLRFHSLWRVLGSFLLFQIFGLGALVLLFFDDYRFALASCILALFTFLYYAREDIKQEGFMEKVRFIGIRCLLNLAHTLGGFLGGLKVGILCITGLLEN